MRSFCLQITWILLPWVPEPKNNKKKNFLSSKFRGSGTQGRILYKNRAVFCLWKVMHAKNFAALLHKLNMRCLVKLYDV